jgi:hypothetical protein
VDFSKSIKAMSSSLLYYETLTQAIQNCHWVSTANMTVYGTYYWRGFCISKASASTVMLHVPEMSVCPRVSEPANIID